MTKKAIIGGACGYWGESPMATGQLLRYPGLKYLVYDYLAEVTMSIMARARLKNSSLGYAPDFISEAIGPQLQLIADKGVKVLSNAGGMNPQACAEAMRKAVADAGLQLKVAVVCGDDLLGQVEQFSEQREMFNGQAFPAADKILSINAYLGAVPVVQALQEGADIVITGRCADSALSLAACMYEHDWQANDYDLMASGSLVGHLLECGPQASGGNFTDWHIVGGLADIGYPVAEVFADGSFELSKVEDSGGMISVATATEQMVYEIGDPQSYLLPDVICDFSEVELQEIEPNRVFISSAKGRAPSGQLKVSVTYQEGFRAGHVWHLNGINARDKASRLAAAGMQRAQKRLASLGLPDYSAESIELFGGRTGDGPYEEITMKAAVQHPEAGAVGIYLKEMMGCALASPPGLHFFTGAGRPKPSPVVRLFSFLLDANKLTLTLSLGADTTTLEPMGAGLHTDQAPAPHTMPTADTANAGEMVQVPLEVLAWARAGDKGDKANIGVLAREEEYLPWIARSLDQASVQQALDPLSVGAVERFYMPGCKGMNLLIDEALGGGGIASLRSDAQGKGFAQRLLQCPVTLPAHIAPTHVQGEA